MLYYTLFYSACLCQAEPDDEDEALMSASSPPCCLMHAGGDDRSGLSWTLLKISKE